MQSKWCLKHRAWTHDSCEHLNNFLHLRTLLAISNLRGLACSTPLFSQRIEALSGEIICKWVTAGYWERSFSAQQSSHAYTTAGRCRQQFTQKEVKGSLRKNAVWSESPGFTVWQLWLPVFRKIMPLQLCLVSFSPSNHSYKTSAGRNYIDWQFSDYVPGTPWRKWSYWAWRLVLACQALLHILWTSFHEVLHWKVRVPPLKSHLQSTNLIQSSSSEN